MYGQAARFSKFRLVLALLATLGIIGGIVMVVLGIIQPSNPQKAWLIFAGAAAVLSCSFAAIIGFISIRLDANTVRVSAVMQDVLEELQKHQRRLADVVDNTRISDSARSLAHREEERIALRGAIQSEISAHNWEAAWHFISEIERRFGFKEEADRLRQQLHEEQSTFYQQEVDKAVPAIEALFQAHDWTKAELEINRLLQAFPKEARFAQLREELKFRHQARKEELIKSFTDAVRRDDIDIDTGMATLKELDGYLTGDEVKKLEESARKVVKGKLEQLGVRFRFAVSEERWRDALEIGVQIAEEFPNSRMATEVGNKFGILRERAGLPSDVEVTSPTATPHPGS